MEGRQKYVNGVYLMVAFRYSMAQGIRVPNGEMKFIQACGDGDCVLHLYLASILCLFT